MNLFEVSCEYLERAALVAASCADEAVYLFRQSVDDTATCGTRYVGEVRSRLASGVIARLPYAEETR